MRFRTLIAGASAVFCVMTFAYAQQTIVTPTTQLTPKQTAIEQSQPHSDSTAQVPTKDQMLASCLALDNQADVIVAKLAATKAKNSEVKALASMIAEEHQECVDKLSKIAPQILLTGSLQQSKMLSDSNNAAGADTASRGTTELSSSVGATSSSMHPNGTSLNIVQLHRELTQQCLIDTQEMLSKKNGGDFDRCFVGLQLAKHSAMKTKLTVFERHTTGELKRLVTDGLETTKKHLAVTEKLMESLASTDNAETSRK